LGKKNVYNDVKKNFKASAELLQEVTKAYVCEAFMEWADLDDMDGKPSNITIPHANTTKAIKKQFMESVIGNFVDEFILPDLDAEKALSQKKSRRQTTTGKISIFYSSMQLLVSIYTANSKQVVLCKLKL
jgi:hypothetical protein